jgi:aminoglycoside N3'-acetyltransferase
MIEYSEYDFLRGLNDIGLDYGDAILVHSSL